LDFPIHDTGCGYGHVSDDGIFRFIDRQFLAVQNQPQCAGAAVTEQEPFISAPDEAFSLF
jgi:hypothetical protein